jgi:NADPH2:quinone reductase
VKAVIDNGQKLEGLSIGQWEQPKLIRPDDVLVQVKAVSLNPVDYKMIEHGMPNFQYPRIPGVDGAGVVTEVGSGVPYLKAGDRVYFHASLARHGSFAEYIVAPAHTLAILPEHVPFDVAAAIPCAGWTAYQALVEKVPDVMHKWVYIQGAAGGTGSYATLIAKRLGAKVIASGSPKDHDYIMSLGADIFLDYHQTDLEERLQQITSSDGGLSIAFLTQTVDKINLPMLYDAMTCNASIVLLLGFKDGAPLPPFWKAINLVNIALGGVHVYEDYAGQINLGEIGTKILTKLRPDDINKVRLHVIPFADIPNALKEFSMGKKWNTSKIVAWL